MKKTLSILTAALLLISMLVFVGCGGDSNKGEYKKVSWSKIESFIQEIEQSASVEVNTRVEDGYTRIYTVGNQPMQVLKGYNKDGVQQLLVENYLFDDDGELEYSEKQYFVDGYFYEKISEKDGGVLETTSIIKEQITFDYALSRTYNKDRDVFSGLNLDMWRPYVTMKADIKFYMLESGEGTKIKVVYKDSSIAQFKVTSTYEYIYDSGCNLVELYSTDDYGAGEDKCMTEIYKTVEPITFPDLTEFDSIAE